MSEFGMLAQAFEFSKINNVVGDYFEFGLWRGKTFRYAYRLRRRYDLKTMHLWGFDSFQGLPAFLDDRDNIWNKGQFACDESELRRILRRGGLSERDYTLIPGFYQESLNDELHDRLKGKSAAVMYVDCDLFESAQAVLTFSERYLVNGTIVCFDDFHNYKSSPHQSEQRALKEFLSQNHGLHFEPYFNYSPLGKSFVVRRD
uniref:Methyltransferase n=1 Tax=uncultured bacterium 14-4D TaxID=1497525 RepID=A0A059TYF0_9BACT|nr:methyltransferase [uncultured bacterium 14-4D]